MALNSLRTEKPISLSWEEKTFSPLLSRLPDLSKVRQMDVSDALKKKLVDKPLEELIKTAEEKWGRTPAPEFLNSLEFQNYLVEGFFNMIQAMVEHAESLPENSIINCGVNEAIFSHASDPKYVLVTDSLATCIGVAGYDSKNRCGFVFHIAGVEELEASKEMLVEKIAQMSKENTGPIELHLRGGIKGYSESIVIAIEEWTEYASKKECAMKIVSREVLTKGLLNESGIPNAMSIRLNTKDGTVSSYDRATNPHAEMKKEIKNKEELDNAFNDIMYTSFFERPKIKVVYFSPVVVLSKMKAVIPSSFFSMPITPAELRKIPEDFKPNSLHIHS